MKLKIAITGSSGFIGQNLYNHVGKIKEWSILPIDRDNLQDILTFQPDVICHLAANPLVKDSGVQMVSSNVALTAQILDYSKHLAKKCHLIFMSSATVYGGNIDAVSEDAVLRPNSVYAATKIAAESLIKAYSHLGYIDYTILRSCANVGKYCTHGVIKDLVYKLQHNSTLEVLGDYPGSCKPYIHVLDTIRAIKHCMMYKVYGTYNLATTNPVTIAQITEILQNTMEIYKTVVWSGSTGTWKGDDQYVHLDSQALQSTGFEFLHKTSEMSIIQGVRDI